MPQLWETPQIETSYITTVDIDAFIDFVSVAGKLKRLSRTGWVECGVLDPESVADHSFRVALIAMLLADERDVDTLKTLRMALIHDLAEEETGDLTPMQKAKDPEAAKNAEEKVMITLLGMLPEKIREPYALAWREFSEAKTPEARLVRDADKLEMVMQASEYQAAGGDETKLMRFWHVEIMGDEAHAVLDEVRRRAHKS